MKNKKQQGLIILCVLLVLIFSANSFGETLVLKSGEKIHGTVVEHKSDSLIFEFSGLQLTFYRDEIEKILPDPIKNISQSSQHHHTVRETSTSVRSMDEVIETAKQMRDDVNEFIDATVYALSEAVGDHNNQEKIGILLDGVRHLEKMKDKVKAAEASEETINLKRILNQYLDQLIVYHSALLKKQAMPYSPEANQAIQEARKEFKEIEETFDDALERIDEVKDRRRSLKKSFSEKKQPMSSINKMEEEYSNLLNRLEELVEINEALTAETQQLVEKNKVLQSRLEKQLGLKETQTEEYIENEALQSITAN